MKVTVTSVVGTESHINETKVESGSELCTEITTDSETEVIDFTELLALHDYFHFKAKKKK